MANPGGVVYAGSGYGVYCQIQNVSVSTNATTTTIAYDACLYVYNSLQWVGTYTVAGNFRESGGAWVQQGADSIGSVNSYGSGGRYYWGIRVSRAFTRRGSAYTVDILATVDPPFGSGNSVADVYGYSIPALDAPAQPGAISIAGNNTNNHILTWEASSGPSVTGYNVYESVNNGNDALVATVTGLTYTPGTRTSGNLYRYRVAAVNARGEGAKTGYATANAAILAPTNMRISNYAAPNTVSVEAFNNNNFIVAREFTVSSDQTNWGSASTATNIQPKTTFGFTYANAPFGTAYFRSRFISPSTSGYSPTVSQITVPPPNAPTNLTITSQSANIIELNWNDNTGTTPYTAGFEIRRNGSITRISRASTYLDTNPSASLNTYDIRAYLTVGNTTLYSSWSSTVTSLPIPSAVTNLTVQTTSDTSQWLSWSAVQTATSYEIWRSVDGNDWVRLGITGNLAYSDTETTANQFVVYRVVAVNDRASTSSKNITPKFALVFGTKRYPVKISKNIYLVTAHNITSQPVI